MIPVLPVEEALVAFVTERCAADEVRVEALGIAPDRLPEGATWLWSGEPCRRRPTLRLVAVRDEVTVLSTTVQPVLEVLVRAPVTAADVEAGARLETVWGQVPVETLIGTPLEGTWEARVALPAGTPVTDRVVRPVPAARQGDAVDVVVERGALRLSAPGTLLGDATVGEAVFVVNQATRVRLRGVLVDAHTVQLP